MNAHQRRLARRREARIDVLYEALVNDPEFFAEEHRRYFARLRAQKGHQSE